jgi:hypothetical protein
MMKLPRSLLGKSALFTVLGLADLALTWYLLRTEHGYVYESNPVARWWLARWGWAGLAGFKLAVVLLVIAAVKGIARHRPRTATHVLSFACGATALVIGYSCTLLGTARAHGLALNTDDMAQIVAEAGQLDARVREMQVYYRLRDQLADDLNAGRYPLDELVARLAATPHARDPSWLKSLRNAYPGRSDRERMAALIRYHARQLTEGIARGLATETSARQPDLLPEGEPPGGTAEVLAAK